MTNNEVATLLQRILASYPSQRQRMSHEDLAGMTVAYVTGLVDLDHAAALHAVERLVRSSKWLPTVAEIREAAMHVTHGARKNGGEAWGECVALVGKYGLPRYPGIDFEIPDPLVAQTIRAFGWRNLCTSENPYADRARFIELFDQLAESDRRDTQASQGLVSTAKAPALPAAARASALPAAPIDAVSPEEGSALLAELVRNLTANDDEDGDS